MGVRGQAGEFEEFVASSGARLQHLAWLLLGDRRDAEDVTQTALERVAQHWSRIRESPEAYARRVVVNASNDVHRRRRSRPQEIGPVLSDPVQSDQTPLLDLRDALLGGLRLLPPRQRIVVVLRYIYDNDEGATADLLGISVGTVRSSSSRGLAQLRQLLPELSPTATEADR